MDIKENNSIDIFGENSVLADHLPGYEFRDTQGQMAKTVEKVLQDEKHLMVEAGTGVGKSLAYLAPSIAWAVKNSKKVVISTNTINLQEQLMYKDLPVLLKIIPYPVNIVLVKGRRNYLCWRRLNRILSDETGSLIPGSQYKELKRIEKWADKTKDGTLSDISWQPHSTLWGEISCEMDNCLGKKCSYCDSCFFQKARMKIFNADVLIVNHHLFFSDLGLRQAGKSILPEYNAAILDEAYFIEEIATEHFGFEVSNLGVKYLLNKLYNPRTLRGILIYLQESYGIELVGSLYSLAETFFGGLREMFKNSKEKIIRIKEPDAIVDIMSPKLLDLHTELKKVKRRIKGNNDIAQELAVYIRRINELIEKLEIFRNQTLIGHVYWIEEEEGKRHRIVLKTFPIVVSTQLKSLLFDSISTVILTGATLSVNNSFEYFKKRLGAEEIIELRLGSPFDYPEQMKIYVPRDMPSPKFIEKYEQALVEKIDKYLGLTKGKAFVLFTNYKLMNEVYNELAPRLLDKGINSFIQGGGLNRHVMLQHFREDKDSVLFGTDSFWTGVDVIGEALSNVIITRLPFAVPNHPLVKARIEFIEEHGGNAFSDYSLPQAVIKLRQGVGRLIRKKTDTGIIAILDKRIINSYYGKYFWDSLPECPRIVE